MADPDFRALCAELVQDIEEWIVAVDHCPPSSSALVQRARAALAQPEPQGPTDEELDELWAEIDGGGAIWAWQDFARAVLARWGRPAIQPVPVVERLPGPDDCDGKGRCWIFDPGDHVSGPVWAFEGSEEFQWLKTQDEDKVQQASQRGRLTWLPHYALPLPTRRTH